MKTSIISFLLLLTSCGETKEVVYQDLSFPTAYKNHLQGITIDDVGFIYASLTTELVKMDVTGNIVLDVKVPNHHGDLKYRNGLVYVAVNLSDQFNGDGQCDNWVYIYYADTLKLYNKIKINELPNGIGSLAANESGDIFFLAGGKKWSEHFTDLGVYDQNFKLIELKHVAVESSYGIQAMEVSGSRLYACGLNSEGTQLYNINHYSGSVDNISFLNCDKGIAKFNKGTLIGIGSDNPDGLNDFQIQKLDTQL